MKSGLQHLSNTGNTSQKTLLSSLWILANFPKHSNFKEKKCFQQNGWEDKGSQRGKLCSETFTLREPRELRYLLNLGRDGSSLPSTRSSLEEMPQPYSNACRAANIQKWILSQVPS